MKTIGKRGLNDLHEIGHKGVFINNGDDSEHRLRTLEKIGYIIIGTYHNTGYWSCHLTEDGKKKLDLK